MGACVNKSVAQAFIAYLLWGTVPLYFHWVASVAPLEVLLVRIASALAFLFVLLAATGQLGALKRLLKDTAACKTLAIASLFLASNWLCFIYGVSTNRVLETSMGYYIGPIISVFLAVIFLEERLNRLQTLALCCILAGVVAQLILAGSLPWIALVLALSWGMYSLMKKHSQTPSLLALTVETLALMPISAVLLVYFLYHRELDFGSNVDITLMLLLSGPVTVLPLLFFGAAVQKLSLISISFMQYIAPTCTFFLAVFYFNEALDVGRSLMQAGIWMGVLIFSLDVLHKLRRETAPTDGA